MKVNALVLHALPLLIAVTGCAAPSLDAAPSEELGDVAEALENANALNANALNANALYPNALNANALNANALNANALNANALTAIQDPTISGALSRHLLRYVVSCALAANQTFAFSWTDSANVTHDELFPGLLGLAKGWASGPLDGKGQKWVSACLASRTNWYGVTVTLSSRGNVDPLKKEGAPELAIYNREEGAFWGNLFTASPALYTCYQPSEVSNARAQMRDCAAGHLGADGSVEPCGMLQIVGSCALHCKKLDAKGFFHPECGGYPTGSPASPKMAEAVTVFLPDVDAVP